MSGLGKTQDTNRTLHNRLRTIRDTVDFLHETLTLDAGVALDVFGQVLDTKLLPQFDPEYPLTVAVTGSGSSGKSSLFNSLIGRNISIVKARAGLSQRVLMAIHPDIVKRSDFLHSLFDAFRAEPEPLLKPEEMMVPGQPKYIPDLNVPSHVVLLDTPDFDTGDRKDFHNRSRVEPVLFTSDVLLYIVTNSNYNNRENTLFLRKALTEIGNRKIVLIYRCSRTLSESEVTGHTEVVARNLYDENFRSWLLGVFRVDEDDDVAEGKAFMKVRPVGNSPDLIPLLQSLDRVRIRAEFMREALDDVRRNAEKTWVAAKKERLILEMYRDTVRIATSWAVAESMKSFPQRELMKQFLSVWEQQQPMYLKTVKRMNRAVAWPMKTVLKMFRKQKTAGPQSDLEETAESHVQFELNLKESATKLRQQIQSSELRIRISESDPAGMDLISKTRMLHHRIDNENIRLPRYESGAGKCGFLTIFRPQTCRLMPFRDLVAGGDRPGHSWKQELEIIRDETMHSTGTTQEFRDQLAAIAKDFRSNMSVKQLCREALTTGLTSIPAIGAVTYVLMTGDPVIGAPNVFAALSGLFGMRDFIAIASIPATMALDEIDRKNLENLLSQVYSAWYKQKESVIRTVLYRNISASVIEWLDERLHISEKPVSELEKALADTFEEMA